MDRRPLAAVTFALLLVLAGCTVGYQSDAPEPSEPPADDHLGYYDGYWYNDTFDIDPSTGLSQGEQRAVFSRAMARIQLLRGLEFEERIDIELITRKQFREEYGGQAFPTPNESVRQLDNVQHEALFLVNESEDVVAVRQGNRGDTVLGFYQPSNEQIVIVSKSRPATLTDEITLAHELVHALQDQRFGLPSTGRTLDGVNARNGLIEGDATLVQKRYERRCASGAWQCVSVQGGGAGGGSPGASFHFGVYFVGFFPYAEGPSFVQYHEQRGGWDAIDDMYGAVPTDAAEVIYPETYATDAYGNATVTDRADADWQRITTPRGDYAEIGQSGLASMFAYTAFEDRTRGVISRDDFRNLNENGSLNDIRQFRYDVTYAEGWYGDRLYAYTSGGDTAFVWNVTFNGPANATEFQRGYEQVFEFWGGERVGTRNGGTVWTFGDADRFGGAVWIQRTDNSVMVVKAPRAGELDDVYAPVGQARVSARTGASAGANA
ncbi:MAG: hypothetical protein ACI8UR_000965 [Natronomonas sp.]|jgi:hypothetical protein|uniref:Hvo_1808 family surface protein n=1 Tax=Natronomonas sp. TaxID=2184060 RepID=UPI00398A334C